MIETVVTHFIDKQFALHNLRKIYRRHWSTHIMFTHVYSDTVRHIKNVTFQYF